MLRMWVLTVLGVALVVGVVTALAVAAVRGLGVRIDAQRPRVGVAVLLLGGGLALGGIALAAQAFDRNAQDVPVLRAGLDRPRHRGDLGDGAADAPRRQGTGYAVSPGCGFRGGLMFPTIFLGVGVTATVALLVGSSGQDRSRCRARLRRRLAHARRGAPPRCRRHFSAATWLSGMTRIRERPTPGRGNRSGIADNRRPVE